jgi:hypothetical protein
LESGVKPALLTKQVLFRILAHSSTATHGISRILAKGGRIFVQNILGKSRGWFKSKNPPPELEEEGKSEWPKKSCNYRQLEGKSRDIK